jgi:DNA-binding NarL/FixJ family response regulator
VIAVGGSTPAGPVIPRRELVTLLAYLETGGHKAAAHRLGISESTSRKRVSQLIGRVGARNAAQAVWALRAELERELGADDEVRCLVSTLAGQAG